MVNGIIMASGLSTRMGENKLLLDFDGISIIEHTFKELKNTKLNDILVVSHYEEVYELSKAYNYKYVNNINAHIGQSESIKLGIKNLDKCSGYMFFVGDQPLINKSDIDKMIDEFNKDREFIIIPKYKNKKGNPVIFPYSKKSDLLRLKKDEKGKKIITNHDKIKFIPVRESMLIDIDDKDDYNRLIRRVK